MRWERGDSPTLMGSNREGIVALELERRVEWNLSIGVDSRGLVEERELGEELQMRLYRSVVYQHRGRSLFRASPVDS